MSEMKPVRCVAENYSPDNPDHYAQWVLSGKPQLPWQCTFYEDLQPDGESYVRRPQEQPPEETPVTDVEREAMEKAAPAKALIVEDAMTARATLATAREKATAAKNLGEVKEAVQVLAEALDAVLAKMQGEKK